MKDQLKHQEVLLFTNTQFSSRQWSSNETARSGSLSQKERFEEACWNGAIREVLPEIFGEPNTEKMLTLWEIREARSFLQLELGTYPVDFEEANSINPYSFANVLSEN